MSIEPIQPITPLYVNKVLATNKLTNEQKFQFLKENMAVIKSFNREEINMHELKEILKTRPLIRFRPLKNSFTKQGDKKLLSKALGIEPSQVDGYINSMVKNGYISSSEADSAYNEELIFKKGEDDNGLKMVMYYQDAVYNELKDLEEKYYNIVKKYTKKIDFISKIFRSDAALSCVNFNCSKSASISLSIP